MVGNKGSWRNGSAPAWHADKIEAKIRKSGVREINSRKIGDMLIKELFNLDPVAYLRFASVYYNFGSPEEFRKYVSILSKKPKRRK